MERVNKILILLFLYGMGLLTGCATDNEPTGQFGQFSGNLLYDLGEHSYRIDLASNEKTDYFNRNTYSLNGWDVSWDGKTRLETSIVTGEFDKVTFKLIDSESLTILKEFVYNNPHGEDRQISGLLSPDKSLILIQPDFDHGIVIIDTEGNVKHHLPMVNDTELTLGDEAIWLSDNSILFTYKEEYILKSEPPYSDIISIREMEYSDWGNLNANPDGTKMSLRIDKHIYLMNADGTGLVQVTESDREEREAVFSPDGKYLLVGANFYPGTFDPGKWDLNIIPADGKMYKVGNNPGPGVEVIRPNGQDHVESATNRMFWR
ncbi:hypothetical protein [Algoriphagus sp. Y33]|uniref:TolB family protein n=1 Tax=Algoriphagus sp. Y33 TaxID=2772483 RepID=UPI0017873608|nr:hypothetical protein [Algoriphagus sp. Y33]